jgi:hypothetical protein
LRLVVWWRGLAALVALLACCAVAAGLLDWRFHLPGLIRALLLVGSLSAAAYVAYRYLLQPLWSKSDDLTLALRVEEHYPVLNDSLASTVEFLQEPAQAEASGSASLRAEAVKRALRLAEGCNFNDVVDSRGVFVVGAGGLAAGVLAALLLLLFPDLAWTAFLRLVEPYGNHSWTRLDIQPCREKVALGQPYEVRGQVGGVIPTQARIEVESVAADGQTWVGNEKKMVSINVDAQTGTGSLAASLDMTQQQGKFRFRVWANDAVYPGRGAWHKVEVVPPPQLVSLDGSPSPQVELRYPAYTGLPSPEKLPAGRGHIEAVSGTEVVLRAAVDRPIAQAWIEFRPEVRLARLGALLGPVSLSEALQTSAAMVGGHALWGNIPAHIEPDGLRFSVTFTPWINGDYLLHLADSEGMARTYEWRLNIFADPVPVVTMEQPSSSQTVLKDAEITIKVKAVDDKYAVRSVYLEYRLKDADRQWLDDGPARLPLHEPGAAEGGPRQRLPRIRVERRWSLAGLVEEGQTLVIQACADDFNDVTGFPSQGRSHTVELQVVSKAQLARVIDEGLGQVQQELVRIHEMQKDALDTVKKIQDKLGKPGYRPHTDLVDTEQKQKQIQARIGNTKDEGLRADLNKLKQMLRDNKLPRSSVDDQLQTVAGELERVQREELQQIEAGLDAARKQLGANPPAPEKSKPPKNAPADKAPLDKARTHQENAQKAFDELVKFMAPWAGLHQVKGTLRKILDQQRDLKKITQKLPDMKQANEFNQEKSKAADAQQELANAMEDVQKTMEQVQKKRAEDGDKNTAKLLQQARDIADKALIPHKMRQAQESIQEEKFFDSTGKQQAAIEGLEKIIAALEERRDDHVGELMRRQRAEEQGLQDLRNRQDILQKKAKKQKDELDQLVKKRKEVQDKLKKKEGDAGKLKQQEEELTKKEQEARRALERLAEEQRKLGEEVKEKARTLARLQASAAGNELSRAGQEMEKAAQQLEQGEDPEEALEQALDRIERAQAKLQQAQNELAREQLEKIADHLKGLRKRQETMTLESARLHKESIERRKHWKDDQLRSLKNLARAQKALGREADSFRDKLKAARVFEHILGKAVRAMDEAAASLEKRFDKGNLRQGPEPLDKEELDDEAKGQEEIQRWQKDAGRRLDRLLEAIKNEPAVARRPPPKNEKDPKPNPKQAKEGQPQGGMAPTDGIPPIAQLKALRDEQREVNERTKDFARRFPNWPKLDNAQMPRMAEIQAELAEIQADQATIQRLFEEITGAPGKKDDNP